MLNRRNAVLGWSVWSITKVLARRKAKAAASSGESRTKKPLLAVGLAGLAGALAFWRKRRSDDDSA
jgi:LPXTG-motif cell wall-anchored protein